jgi:Flp pilus assembly protein TadD
MRAARLNRLGYLSLGLVLLWFCQVACGPGQTAEEYVSQGKKLLQARQYDQAIASFSEAIRLDAKIPQAYNNRGIAYCQKGDFDRAIDDFSRVIALDPKNGKAYNNRAVAYLQKGQLDQARRDVEKAQSLGIAVNPVLLDSLSMTKGKK